MKPLRWAVVLVDFDPTVGHEEAGHRRAVVVSYEAFHSAGMAAVSGLGELRIFMTLVIAKVSMLEPFSGEQCHPYGSGLYYLAKKPG